MTLALSSLLFILSWSTVAFPQDVGPQIKPQFISNEDQALTLNSVAILDFYDNMNNIYAKDLSVELKSLIESDAQWLLKKSTLKPAQVPLLTNNSKLVMDDLSKSNSDGLFTGQILKGPAGLRLDLMLFSGANGYPLLIESENLNFQSDTKSALTSLNNLYSRIKKKLPYRGQILSRNGNQVTVSFGQTAGVSNGDELTVVQFVKAVRHPKTKTIIATDKVVLGKIRVTQSEPELSFGQIIFEKELGLLAPGHKILSVDQVAYPDPASSLDQNAIEQINARNDIPVSFGARPSEWLPQSPPQYGKIQLLGGIAQYSQTTAFSSAGSITGSTSFAPMIALNSEAWVNELWLLQFKYKLSAFSIDNTLVNSSPSKLTISTNKYSLAVGRNFLLGVDFLGPKMTVLFGYNNFQSKADQSTPVAQGGHSYGGMYLSGQFMTSIYADSPFEVGGEMTFMLFPQTSTSGGVGSASSPSSTDFAFLGSYIVSKNFKYIAEIGFEHYSSSLSGSGSDPATGASQKNTGFMLGLEYLF